MFAGLKVSYVWRLFIYLKSTTRGPLILLEAHKHTNIICATLVNTDRYSF